MGSPTTVLIIDNSDHRRAGAWFARCVGRAAVYEVKRREDAAAYAEGWRAVMLSGSERSIFEDHAWVTAQEDWVRRWAAAGVPVLGVCFGHQLILRAYGGKECLVRRPSPEVGWVNVHLAADPWFGGLPATITPYSFHFDQGVAPPGPAWEVIAWSESCPVAGIRHRRFPLVGVQFHPEIDVPDAIAGYLREKQLLAEHGVDAGAIVARGPAGPAYFPRIIKNFVKGLAVSPLRINLTPGRGARNIKVR
jgi:GMP synthase (glutamine-hydrolysing)